MRRAAIVLVAAALAICGFAAAVWLWRDRPPATGVAILDGLEPRLRALHVRPPADREPNLALELPLVPEVIQVPEGTPAEGMIAFRNAGQGPLTILALAALDERIRMRVEVGGIPYTFGAPIEAGAEGKFIYEVSPLRGDRTVCLSVEVLTNDPHFIVPSSGAFGRAVIDLRVQARSSVIVRALDGVVTEWGIALGSFCASMGTEHRAEISTVALSPISAVECEVSDQRLRIELVSAEAAPNRELRFALLGPLPEGALSLNAELTLHFSDGSPSKVKYLHIIGYAQPDLYFMPQLLTLVSRKGMPQSERASIEALAGVEFGAPELRWVTAQSTTDSRLDFVEVRLITHRSASLLELRLRKDAPPGIHHLEVRLPYQLAGRQMEARLPVQVLVQS